MADIDFAALKKRFDEMLSNGDRAEIRRVKSPDDLAMIPAYYRLLKTFGAKRSTSGWERLVYMLPYAGHRENGPSIGEALKLGKISEMRMFQVMRSEPPQDMENLRRLLQQVKPKVDWRKFGAILFYWNERNKRNIVEDFFLSGGNKDKTETKTKQEAF